MNPPPDRTPTPTAPKIPKSTRIPQYVPNGEPYLNFSPARRRCSSARQRTAFDLADETTASKTNPEKAPAHTKSPRKNPRNDRNAERARESRTLGEDPKQIQSNPIQSQFKGKNLESRRSPSALRLRARAPPPPKRREQTLTFFPFRPLFFSPHPSSSHRASEREKERERERARDRFVTARPPRGSSIYSGPVATPCADTELIPAVQGRLGGDRTARVLNPFFTVRSDLTGGVGSPPPPSCAERGRIE
ncbi:hypothetical protein NL676_028659 [Syzygium grande]|nr:hypothetical protein NL676_028659 [Syzygium grande]